MSSQKKDSNLRRFTAVTAIAWIVVCWTGFKGSASASSAPTPITYEGPLPESIDKAWLLWCLREPAQVREAAVFLQIVAPASGVNQIQILSEPPTLVTASSWPSQDSDSFKEACEAAAASNNVSRISTPSDAATAAKDVALPVATLLGGAGLSFLATRYFNQRAQQHGDAVTLFDLAGSFYDAYASFLDAAGDGKIIPDLLARGTGYAIQLSDRLAIMSHVYDWNLIASARDHLMDHTYATDELADLVAFTNTHNIEMARVWAESVRDDIIRVALVLQIGTGERDSCIHAIRPLSTQPGSEN